MSSLSVSEPRRPRLLAQNRKLRHLKGVSLRNLCFAPPARRAADDAAVDVAADRSSRRLDLLREAGQLHPSRSSDSLNVGKRPSQPPLTQQQQQQQREQQEQQPRRASLGWAHASPTSRQRRLEGLVESAVGDVFVSLHAHSDTDPVYISEVRQRSAVSSHTRRRRRRPRTEAC